MSERKLPSAYDQGWNDAVEAAYDMLDYGVCERCQYGEDCSQNPKKWLRWCNETSHYTELMMTAVKELKK